MQPQLNITDTYDRNLILSAFQRASSITEAAKLMGITRSAMRRRVDKFGLQKECLEMIKRKSNKILPQINSLQNPINKDPKPVKPVQRLQTKCSDQKALSSLLEEELALKGEMRKAQQEEQHEKINLSEKQSNDFFAELKTRLGDIVEARNEKTSNNSKVEKKVNGSLSKREIAEVLLTIVPILVAEYNQLEN